MESMGVGFMAVFAVSGSVAFIARQLHKRLISDFMKKIEFELAESRDHEKKKKVKKVKFAENVMEPSSDNKEYRRKRWSSINDMEEEVGNRRRRDKVKDKMPVNWQILYKGKYRSLKC